MFGLGAGELLLISILGIVILGPRKIPELFKSLGHGLREFQKAKQDVIDDLKDDCKK